MTGLIEITYDSEPEDRGDPMSSESLCVESIDCDGQNVLLNRDDLRELEKVLMKVLRRVRP